jgi:hypothetical protein
VVIASSYLTSASAFLQSMFTLETGWSCKYAVLFANCGGEENLVSVPGPEGALEAAILRPGKSVVRAGAARAVKVRAEVIEKNIHTMWADVFALIDRDDPCIDLKRPL